MRADRLVSVLMILQRRNRITVPELAQELEVSERTARRDLEALSMSGVPVYSQSGRGGGWSLVGGATTDLTGLSRTEARALFIALGSIEAIDGGIGRLMAGSSELASALRKLEAAMPASFRADIDAASDSVTTDSTSWGRNNLNRKQPEFLKQLAELAIAGHQARIDYESPRSPRRVRTVHPLGLVSKRGAWYLVANTSDGMRTFRVSRIASMERTGDPVDRPVGFDLDETWRQIVTDVESRRVGITVELEVDQSMVVPIRWQFGSDLTVLDEDRSGDQEKTSMIRAKLWGHGESALAAQLAGYGHRVRLIDPSPALQAEFRRIAQELGDLYLTDPLADRVQPD